MRLMRRIGLLPLSTLFPYTTLFRSHDVVVVTGRVGSQFVGLLRAAAAARPHRHVQGTGPRGVEVEAELAPREASRRDRKSTRLNSSHVEISYAVFCLKKKR